MSDPRDPTAQPRPRVADVLTDAQRHFCREFLVDCNYEKAARRVGQTEKWGRREIADPLVCSEIARLRQDLSRRAEVTVERIVDELAKIGFANAGDYFDWGPDGVTVRDKSELTPDQTAAVAEVSQTVTEKGGTIRVKLHDKPAALTQLGRHLGMFLDKVEHDFPVLSDEERIERAAALLDKARARRDGSDPADAG